MKRPRSAPSELRTGALLVCGLFSGVSPYGLLPPRSNQGIWGGRRLGYELRLKIWMAGCRCWECRRYWRWSLWDWYFRLLAKRPPELLLWRPFVYLQMRALVVLGQTLDVVGDHVFLVGGDDHDRDGRAGGADDLRAVAHGLAVLVVIDAHAQPLKAVAEGLAD